MYVCATCLPSAHEGQKRVSDPLRLELQTVVRHQVGARNQNHVSASALNC